MKLKTDGLSAGWAGIIYDADDPAGAPIWRCTCNPPHRGKADAKVCANNRLRKLKRKDRR